MRLLLAPAICVATVAGGSTVALADDGASPTLVADAAATNRLSTATRGDSTPTRPVPQPEPAPAPVPAPATNTSPPSRLLIPHLGIDRSIHQGGQEMIDAGQVTWYDPRSTSWPEPDLPGHPGTFWVAAHRTTYGASFIRLPEIQVGDHVHVQRVDGTVVTFRIDSVERVPHNAGYFAIYGYDRDAASIALQTSLPNNHRLVARGTMI